MPAVIPNLRILEDRMRASKWVYGLCRTLHCLWEAQNIKGIYCLDINRESPILWTALVIVQTYKQPKDCTENQGRYHEKTIWFVLG